MYIGKLGDGSSDDDGIYVLVKEVIDNCIDEFAMGFGKQIDLSLTPDGTMSVRDYGRGVPLGKLMDCAAKINTGAKYDSEVFKKSVGLNGVGIKAVNALSKEFRIEAFRDGETRRIDFAKGDVVDEDKKAKKTTEDNGTSITFTPDVEMFRKFRFRERHLEKMLRYYCYLNPGLNIRFNGKRFRSKNGLCDLLEEVITEEVRYPIVHLSGHDIEIAFTHVEQTGEEYYSFANGQHTTQGGTHQAAFREAIAKTIREFYKKSFEAVDIRNGIVAAISIKIEEPVFESQTKTKLGSLNMSPEGATVRNFVLGFIKEKLDNYLHKHPEVSEPLLARIQQAEHERKELKGIKKIARERAKKAKIHNRKLRDCRSHLNTKDKQRFESTLFITEGDSASGSITKSRNVTTQAVFSLKGKPLNCFGLTKKVVYENEEFNLIQHALNIEDDLENLRYNKIVIATDADVDGMHIRLLLITFFLQFFPELIREQHLYILQTPLFRVRNKKDTRYCYTELERQEAISSLGAKAEITRFKGLGEISPDEFKYFIGDEIRLDPVMIKTKSSIKEMLKFYMGKNTPDRQEFIIENLRVEQDVADEEKDEEPNANVEPIQNEAEEKAIA
ncbi:MAG: type IIA DNA topoisomerase subunit B [Opitutae bacterium]|nr:type IIA DNA topoisomerase subunit B [Opitutae bacterium]MBT5691361.1 type IIA DNA topoisomerase subunit B [Opitutae bacterium]MBT6463638.1 type IIA DNA topoisomerase subunit B [Opitutae bacterium]MBT7855275.1 type IIA DNA topoisomerase subunit B [Opitutae bacterium]